MCLACSTLWIACHNVPAYLDDTCDDTLENIIPMNSVLSLDGGRSSYTGFCTDKHHTFQSALTQVACSPVPDRTLDLRRKSCCHSYVACRHIFAVLICPMWAFCQTICVLACTSIVPVIQGCSSWYVCQSTYDDFTHTVPSFYPSRWH